MQNDSESAIKSKESFRAKALYFPLLQQQKKF